MNLSSIFAAVDIFLCETNYTNYAIMLHFCSLSLYIFVLLRTRF